MNLTIEQIATEIEESDFPGCEFDDGRFIVRIDPANEFLIQVDEMDDWGGSTIYNGTSPYRAARAISAERNR